MEHYSAGFAEHLEDEGVAGTESTRATGCRGGQPKSKKAAKKINGSRVKTSKRR